MIYGLNFTGQQIPQFIARRFAQRLNGSLKPVGADRACEWRLQGVCQTSIELDRMAEQANNGKRRFHFSMRKINGELWTAFYTGYK